MQIDIQRDRARTMRKHMTSAERKLWSALKGRALGGFRFHRQVQIGPRIVDFLCRERKLIVEVDGATHSSANEVDTDCRRTAYLMAQGYVVFRVWNADVYQNLSGVADALLMALVTREPQYRRQTRCATPSPCGHSPSKAGEDK